MIWVTWRQFRAQAITAVIILAAAVTYLVITGLQIRHTYAADLASCTPTNDCSDVLNQFSQDHEPAFHLIGLFVMVAPGLIGIFWGAPLIGRELETGTHQLAWNQTVTRTRWLAVKLAGVGAASVAVAGLLSYLLTWWAGPFDQIIGSRFDAMTFASRDVVPLAYAAFAFALGTTAGLLIRRTIPAMAVTLAVFVGMQILMPTAVRPNLLPSTTLTFPINQSIASQARGIFMSNGGAEIHIDGLPVPDGAWIVSAPPVETSSGQVVAAHDHLNCFPGLNGLGAKGEGPRIEQIMSCLGALDLHESITYQPASHYWPLQWIESGIFLALAGGLSGFCFWRIRRRQN
jgi:ABC-type transport system involved in multi-copper enzyme maturation permease subunit